MGIRQAEVITLAQDKDEIGVSDEGGVALKGSGTIE